MRTQNRQKKTLISFLINNLLLLCGIMVIVSGLTIQLAYHMGSSEPHHRNNHEVQPHSITYEQDRGFDTVKTVWGFNYHQWSTIHKLFIVLFSLIMIYHFYIHWKWYKGVINKHLIKKNSQVITLTILFLFVAFTGLIPWFIDLSGSKSVWRFILIEIHDKLTLVLIIFLILHFIKRSKWFKDTYSRLKQ
jgi:hypothetical protein